MRIPYGELQTINFTVNNENGYEHVLERVHYALVIPCRDCRFCGKGNWGVEAFPVCRRGIHAFQVSKDGFCAWGKRIVRCKDCVSSYRDEDGMWCCFHGTGFYRKPTDEDNYCSKGNRRDA